MIGGKLILITNRKSHIGLQSLTLNDLKRRNGHYSLLLFIIIIYLP